MGTRFPELGMWRAGFMEHVRAPSMVASLGCGRLTRSDLFGAKNMVVLVG
jgi:hypothetical protein